MMMMMSLFPCIICIVAFGQPVSLKREEDDDDDGGCECV